jgi:hypothetical protein
LSEVLVASLPKADLIPLRTLVVTHLNDVLAMRTAGGSYEPIVLRP